MARRRARRSSGLLTHALGSGWRFSAVVAVLALLFGVGVLPSVLAGNKYLAGLVPMVRTLAWGVVALFGMIALAKWLMSWNGVSNMNADGRASGAVDRGQHMAGAGRIEPTALDAAWTASAPPAGPAALPRPTTWSRELLDQVEWKRFEELCCAFYREKGIRAEVTPLGPDGGIDISLHQDEAQPDRVTAIVQCKAWNQAVGVKPVRELRGVMAHKQVEKAFFMAPQGFTEDARAFAKENRIILLNGALFCAMIKRLPAISQQRLLELATAGDWTTPSCPVCGTKMVARESKRGRFWGCSAYPRCRGRLPMRRGVTEE
jgi:restriction system protein